MRIPTGTSPTALTPKHGPGTTPKTTGGPPKPAPPPHGTDSPLDLQGSQVPQKPKSNFGANAMNIGMTAAGIAPMVQQLMPQKKEGEQPPGGPGGPENQAAVEKRVDEMKGQATQTWVNNLPDIKW